MSMHNISDEFSNLVRIISRLRDENGCPWDRKQTPSSLTKYLVEETQELADAIKSGDTKQICEEIGDLFYILILLSGIHSESKEFTLDDVLAGISQKMIRRHPHVFAGQESGNENDMRKQWVSIKSEEKSQKKI